MIDEILQEFRAQQQASPDLYAFLNGFRAWFNLNVRNYEFFLEDNWFDERTTIEYTIRSLDSLNQVIFAEDEYKNHIAQGTWHLGEYVKTYWIVDDPVETLQLFMQENPAPVSTRKA